MEDARRAGTWAAVLASGSWLALFLGLLTLALSEAARSPYAAARSVVPQPVVIAVAIGVSIGYVGLARTWRGDGLGAVFGRDLLLAGAVGQIAVLVLAVTRPGLLGLLLPAASLGSSVLLAIGLALLVGSEPPGATPGLVTLGTAAATLLLVAPALSIGPWLLGEEFGRAFLDAQARAPLLFLGLNVATAMVPALFATWLAIRLLPRPQP